jgi:hypothetical protein
VLRRGLFFDAVFCLVTDWQVLPRLVRTTLAKYAL